MVKFISKVLTVSIDLRIGNSTYLKAKLPNDVLLGLPPTTGLRILPHHQRTNCFRVRTTVCADKHCGGFWQKTQKPHRDSLYRETDISIPFQMKRQEKWGGTGETPISEHRSVIRRRS